MCESLVYDFLMRMFNVCIGCCMICVWLSYMCVLWFICVAHAGLARVYVVFLFVHCVICVFFCGYLICLSDAPVIMLFYLCVMKCDRRVCVVCSMCLYCVFTCCVYAVLSCVLVLRLCFHVFALRSVLLRCLKCLSGFPICFSFVRWYAVFLCVYVVSYVIYAVFTCIDVVSICVTMCVICVDVVFHVCLLCLMFYYYYYVLEKKAVPLVFVW